MNDEKIIIDLGVWNLPKSWDDVTLAKFSNLQRIKGEGEAQIYDLLQALCDKTRDEVMQLPIEFVEKMLNRMDFIYTTPEVAAPTNKIEIDGETYMVNYLEKLKAGEYISFDTVIKSDQYNYAAMLAILCRKPDEIYDSKFEAEKFEDREKMFGNQPITKILPIINFFLNLYMVSEVPSHLYSQVEEAINLTRQDIENSPNLGPFRKFFLKWRVKKLQKLLKSSRNT